jgi:YfiH family protein
VFKDLFVQNKIVGTYYQNEYFRVIFGNKFANREILEKDAKHILLLKQVHSAKVVEANVEIQEADSHYSSSQRLGIVTADCVPILFYMPELKVIAACHAGWRGLKDHIISKTLSITNEDPKNIKVFVGPHIRRPNFEVHNDVAQIISDSVSTDLTIIYPHSNKDKKYVDLTKVTEAHLTNSGILYKNIYFDSTDTFVSKDYASFRRDGSKAERQISTIELV